MFALFRPEFRPPTNRLPDYLPWYGLIAPGVVLQKNAAVQKTYAFRGHDHSSSSKSQKIACCANLNNAVKRLGSGWCLFIETQRAPAPPIPSALWREAAAWLVDRERREGSQGHSTQFETTHYITFVWQLPRDADAAAKNLFFDDPQGHKPRIAFERDLEFFTRTIAELVDIMRSSFAEVEELDDAETLTYLHSTISTERHAVTAPPGQYFLDDLLADMPLTSGVPPMLGNAYMPTAVVTGFAPQTSPGVFSQLDELAFPYRFVIRFECLDRKDAQSELESLRRTYWAGRKSLLKLMREEAFKEESPLVNNASGNKAAEIDSALQALGEDLVGFGRLTITVTTWDADIDLARQQMLAIKRILQSRAMVVRDETLNALAAWLGSLPGHVYSNVRRGLVSSINVAHFMPTSSVWAGDAYNKHFAELTGEQHTHIHCSTDGSTPFRLNLNVGDVGHTLLIGPPGAGKSTFLSLMALQFLKYPQARVIIFDKDRSARAATLAVGGAIYEPGSPDAPMAFQPLANIDEPAERLWASEFILDLLQRQLHTAPTVADKAALDRGLTLLAAREPQFRTLLNLADVLGKPSLCQALRPYTAGGEFGQIFGAERDRLRTTNWMMLEMGHLMALGPDATVPALEYLFHRVQRALDGRPTLILFDESWRALQEPRTAGRIKGWAKELRKKNAYMVLATHEVEDVTNSPIMATLLSACRTKIFLPNAGAQAPMVQVGYRGLGLSDTEIETIATARPKRDYFYASEKGRRLFSLDLGPVGRTFAAMSGEADQKVIDAIVAANPLQVFAEALLRFRGLSWAADLIGEFREKRRDREHLPS